jgi:serine protease inhibitor
MRWLSLLVVTLALVASGCGGGSSESAATTTETTAETTTTSDTTATETTTTDTTTDTTSTDLSGILGNEDCLALASVGATMAQAFSGATGTTQENKAELDKLASKVPDEIKADVEVLAKAFATYSAKLQDIGIKAGATPTAAQLQQLQAALASLDQQELTAASNRIEAWSKEHCTG